MMDNAFLRDADVPLLLNVCSLPTVAPFLSRLYLGGNLFEGGAGVISIMRDVVCAPFSHALRELDLSRNPGLGVEGAAALAAWLPKSDIKALALSDCDFEDAAGIALAGFASAPTLLRLDLRRNNFGDGAAKALMVACGVGKAIEEAGPHHSGSSCGAEADARVRLMLDGNDGVSAALRQRAAEAEAAILAGWREKTSRSRTWRGNTWA